jgi:hypothetical protein
MENRAEQKLGDSASFIKGEASFMEPLRQETNNLNNSSFHVHGNFGHNISKDNLKTQGAEDFLDVKAPMPQKAKTFVNDKPVILSFKDISYKVPVPNPNRTTKNEPKSNRCIS